MEEFHGKIEGPCRIERDVKFHGMITKQATIAPGVEFILHGMVTGDLIAEERSRITIYGMVNGLVRNLGGEITIFGWVDELDDPVGNTVIRPGARVRGRNGGPM